MRKSQVRERKEAKSGQASSKDMIQKVYLTRPENMDRLTDKRLV